MRAPHHAPRVVHRARQPPRTLVPAAPPRWPVRTLGKGPGRPCTGSESAGVPERGDFAIVLYGAAQAQEPGEIRVGGRRLRRTSGRWSPRRARAVRGAPSVGGEPGADLWPRHPRVRSSDERGHVALGAALAAPDRRLRHPARPALVVRVAHGARPKPLTMYDQAKGRGNVSNRGCGVHLGEPVCAVTVHSDTSPS
jgi:hypothetical protein